MQATRHGGAGWLGGPARSAVGVHLVIRAASVLAVLIAAAAHPLGTGSLGGDVGAALGKSDGVWYLGIAHHGYGPPPPIGPDGAYTHLTSLAFFPLYPMLVRGVAMVGLPYLGAALVVTLVAGALAAALIVAWARPRLGARGALALLVAWELLPSSIVLGMAYSEALFVAAAAGCLLALQRGHWLAAGLAAAAAGLTRPTGGCLILAIGAAAWAETRRSDADLDHAARPWRLVIAVLLGAAGLAAALIHVAVVTGRIDGWFWLERTVWNSGFDAGWSALHNYGELATGGRTAHRLPEIIAAATVVGVIAVAVWARRSRRTRLGGPATAYAASAAVLAIGERGYFYVKPRLLFVAFPLLLPVGAWLDRQPRLRLAAIGLLAGLLSLSYNAYLLVGWPKAL